MKAKSWEEIAERIRAVRFEEEFDLLVAVANGGIIPAALLNQRLQLELQLLKLNFRGADQQPVYDAPRLLEEIDFAVKGRKILLVEDRIKTGATVACARRLLAEAARVRTFAVNGSADYCLYNEACFRFPWML